MDDDDDDDSAIPEAFDDDWEQVQSPIPQIPPEFPHSTQSETTVIGQNCSPSSSSSVSPPSHPEGLPVPRRPVSPPSDAPPRRGETWRRLWLMSYRVRQLGSAIGCYAAACKRRCWPSGSAAAGVVTAAALLLLLLYARRVQRWRGKLEKDRLMLLIREKDEKIRQLLLQVAQMNELLSARRRVPVLRIG